MCSEYFPSRDQRMPEERQEAIFAAASDAIFESSQQMIGNYAGDDMAWEDAAVAVGKALVVNGTAAVCAGTVGEMSVEDMNQLCDVVMSFLADYLENIVGERAA